MQQKEFSLEVGGRQLTAIFSDWADQANGSVLVRYGQTVVLATAVMAHFEREGLDFFPLTVDYEEKFYAAGKILGGRFIKREGRPSDEAILGGRIVDRTIRPLFDHYLRRDIQVIITVLSIDEDNDPDVPSIIAASLALGVSDIPWHGPVSAVRLGQPATAAGGGATILNPRYGERVNAPLDLLVCGKDNKINMIEAETKEIPEAEIAAAFQTAAAEIEKIQLWQKQIIKEIGRAKQEIAAPILPEAVIKHFEQHAAAQFESAVYAGPGKSQINGLKDQWLKQVKDTWFPSADSRPGFSLAEASEYFEQRIDQLIHRQIIEQERRPDGRKLNELRPIFAQAGGLSTIVHGAGVFYRGGTHILSVLTLGGPKDAQLLEGMETRGDKYFMHHYNFPPFSTGETGRLGGTNRRSIGHGALAEKSLRGVIPSREVFPYTIRLVSESLASNGSTSMGSVCGSTLALMDGGVPIKAPVAGIAMGLMLSEAKSASGEMRYKILTDIQGPEDHHGDMDFKVAGTKDGVTGIQLDIKIDGIPIDILTEALTQAKVARLQILEKITAAIPAPRPQLAPNAPAILTIKIPVDKIGSVIGPGGKIIQKITADTGAEIAIEDDGSVFITGKIDQATLAKKVIETMTHEYRVGEKFEAGVVTRIESFGAFVKIGYEAEGLVHISEIAPFRINRVEDALKLGDKVPVVIHEIDEKGRINLSIKAIDPDFAKRKGVQPGADRPPMGGNGFSSRNNRRY